VLTLASPAFAASGGGTAPGGSNPLAYSGEAYAVGIKNLTVLGSPVRGGELASTGPLPAKGGKVTAPIGTINLPGNLGTVTVTAGQVTGAGGAANASEKVAGLSLLDAHQLLKGLSLGNLPALGNILGNLLNGGLLTAPKGKMGSGSSGQGCGGLLGCLLNLGGSNGGGLLGACSAALPSRETRTRHSVLLATSSTRTASSD
jgi:hypothetical protein